MHNHTGLASHQKSGLHYIVLSNKMSSNEFCFFYRPTPIHYFLIIIIPHDDTMMLELKLNTFNFNSNIIVSSWGIIIIKKIMNRPIKKPELI